MTSVQLRFFSPPARENARTPCSPLPHPGHAGQPLAKTRSSSPYVPSLQRRRWWRPRISRPRMPAAQQGPHYAVCNRNHQAANKDSRKKTRSRPSFTPRRFTSDQHQECPAQPHLLHQLRQPPNQRAHSRRNSTAAVKM